MVRKINLSQKGTVRTLHAAKGTMAFLSYQALMRALGNTTYGLGHLGLATTDVYLDGSVT